MQNEIQYPYICEVQVPHVFEEKIAITLYSGMTVFVGPNGIGKTQTLKTLRNYLKGKLGQNKVRYLSSNRIGGMETYRSRINQFAHSAEEYQVGDQKTKAVRHQIETSTGDFFTMDERKDVYIKVAERLSVLFKRQIYLRWDSGNMKVYFEKTDGKQEYSVAAEASGLVNIISILAALFDEEVKVLLIDEPEVSLHPQLQSYLLREMNNAIKQYGKTVIISTHSAEMISFNKVEDISNFVFFSENNAPVQVKPDAPELKNRKLKDFLLRMGQVYKNGFFAKKILLIEGASDLIVCHFLSNKLDYNVDVAGSQIVPVDGKGQFPIITKLFRLINKEVALLTDLDGFIDDNNVIDIFSQLPSSVDLASEMGAANITDMVQKVKTTLADIVNKHREDMKDIYEVHPYWVNKKAEDDETKIARRAMLGKLFCATENDIEQWPDSEDWKRLKKRIVAIFSILEEVGCFILKKGAIESYYQFASDTTYSEKPSAAAEEISKLDDMKTEDIVEYYKDVVNALKYIAMTDEIDESLAVKKELLSELALVLGILKKGITDKEIYAAIKQAKNNAVSLFKYQVITDGDRLGVTVDLQSQIIQVNGFPFDIYMGQNVNETVDKFIKKR